MSGNSRRLLAAAVVPAAVAAAVLAGPGAAGASTGPRYASAEQAGYAATGAPFNYLTASIYLRNPAQYAGLVGQYSQTIQLWSSGLVAVFGASASTSGSSYTPYARIFDATSHQLLASNPHAYWCDRGTCGPAIGSFPAGGTLRFQAEFIDGNLSFVVVDAEAGTVFGAAPYKAGRGVSFTQARVGTEFGSNPWTAPSSYTHPAAWTKIAVYTKVRLQTYNGKTGTSSSLASWFPHHKIFMVGVTGSLLDVQAAPTDLSSGGWRFQNWLAPAGVNGPAPPPQG